MTTVHQHTITRREGPHCYTHCVGYDWRCEPRAHGNVIYVDICACGARRAVAVNGRYRERSAWRSLIVGMYDEQSS